MDLKLTNKRSLVMGSTSGLGEGIVRSLAREGARVAITGRRITEARRIANELGSAVAINMDLDSVKSVQLAIEEVATVFGGIDILVCNGGGPKPGPVPTIDINEWEMNFRSMFINQLRVVNAFLPGMRKRRWGRILVIASSGIQQPIPNLCISNTLRTAQLAWAKTLSNEVASEGVTVNVCIPGRIHTNRVEQLDSFEAKKRNKDIEEIRSISRANIPVGRYGSVEEFADTAVYLLSENASYITGTTVRIDGGLIRGL